MVSGRTCRRLVGSREVRVDKVFLHWAHGTKVSQGVLFSPVLNMAEPTSYLLCVLYWGTVPVVQVCMAGSQLDALLWYVLWNGNSADI